MRTTNQTLTRLIVFLCLAVPSFWGGSFVFAYDSPFANTSVNVNTTNHTATVRNLPRNSDERFNSSSLPSRPCVTVDEVNLVGDGSADHPFEIGTVDQWNAFAFIVNDRTGMNTACAKLTADITFTNNHSQPGIQSQESGIKGRQGNTYYCGTFDGQGHTITLNFNEYKENGVLAGGPRPEKTGNSLSASNVIGTWGGLFFYVGSATIKNLHVAGTIRSQLIRCGTIAHNVSLISNSNPCNIINCQSTVEVISVNGSDQYGGLVGQQSGGTINISNCFANGKLSIDVSNYTKNYFNSGCVGSFDSGSLNISNSYVQPQDIQETGTNSNSYYAWFRPFSYSSYTSPPNPTVTNSYYKLPSGFNVDHLSTSKNQGTDKEAPSTVDATVAALNTDLTTEAWETHNGIIYLKTFAKYVHIDSWTYGSPNTPTIVGNNGNGAVTYQYKVQGASDATYATYTPGTTVLNVGNYTLKASVAAVTDGNGEKWNAWESTMDFTVSAAAGAISAAPTAASPSYNGNSQALLATNGTATGTFYYRVGTTGDWSTTPPSETAAGTYYVYYYVAPDGNHTADNLGSSSSPLEPIAVTIEPKSVTVFGITALNKTYDGSTTATLDCSNATLAGMVGGDDLSVSATGQFASRDAGTNKTVTIIPALEGASAGNYTIASSSTTANITPRPLTITGITASNKTYDGSTTAIVNGTGAIISGLISGDDLTCTYTGEFDNANVGTGKAVTVNAYISGGASAGNYQVASCNSPTAAIAPKALTVTANPKTITYGDAPANDGVTYSGFITGEDENTSGVLGGTLAYNYSYAQYDNVGDNYTITPSGLTSNNYAITYNTGKLTVLQKALTIKAKDQAISYGTTIAKGTGQVTTEGLVTGDALTDVKLTPSTSDYTTNGTITPSDATTTKGIGNYSVTYTDGALTIGKVALTITAKDKTITYGDAPANDGVTYSGFIGDDDESVLGGTLAYTYNYAKHDDVGSYTITPSGLTSTNYAITFTPGTLTVEKKAMTINGITASNKTYDGNTTATLVYTNVAFAGKEGNDELTVSATGQFADANVGTGKTVTISGLSLGGSSAGNYEVASCNSPTANITPKEVGVKWGPTVFTYKEGVAQAPTATATGLIEGDECIVTVEGQQTAVGEGYTATATGLTGAKSGNYKLPTTGLSADFEIAPQLSVQFAAGQQWATWYDERTTHNYVIPEGIKGYVVKDVIGTKVIVEELSLGYLPAQTGLLLKRATTTAAQDIASNIFTGDLGNTVPSSLLTVGSPMPVVAYMLQNDEFFVTTESTLPEHSCYLPDLGSTTTVDDPSAILGPSLIPARYVEADKPYADTFYDGTWKPYGDVMTYLPVDYNLDEGTVSLVKVMGAPNGQPVILDAAEDSQTAHYFMVSVLDDETAQSILDDYKSKAAAMNGRFVITDGMKSIAEIISGAGVTADEALLLVLANGKFSTVDVSAADLDKKAKAGLLLFVLTKWEYMHVKPSNGNSQGYVGSRTISIIGDNATGIEEMHDVRSMMDDVWYDLQGRKIDLPTRKGLYIRNGKKIVIR